MFTELPRSLVWCLTLLLGRNSQSCGFKCFFWFLPSAPYPPSALSDLMRLSPQFSDALAFFSRLFSLCNFILEVSIDISSSPEILPFVVFNLLMSLSKALFLLYSISTLFLLRIFSLFLHYPYIFPFCLLLPIRAFNIVIIIVLHFWSDNSNIPAMFIYNAFCIS